MKKVICIGEALIDIIVQDEKVIEENVGGAPLNVACSIGFLKGDAAFFGAIGADSNGKRILDLLTKFKVNRQHTQILKDHKTSTANVSIWEDGERNFTFDLDADQNIEFASIRERVKDFDIFHFGSATSLLKKAPRRVYELILIEAVKHNKFIVFDPNWRNLLWENNEGAFRRAVKPFLLKAALVKLSEEELQIICEIKDTQDAVKKIVEQFPQATFLITLGPKGSIFANKDGIKEIVTEPAKNVVDTTGAGDAFIAYVIYQISILSDPSDWLKNSIAIIEAANEFAKKSILYKGALTFLDN